MPILVSSRIIKDSDDITPSDKLIFSSLRTRSEIEKRRSHELRVWNGYVTIDADKVSIPSAYTITESSTIGNMTLETYDVSSTTGIYQDSTKQTTPVTSANFIKLKFNHNTFFIPFGSGNEGSFDTTVFVNKVLVRQNYYYDSVDNKNYNINFDDENVTLDRDGNPVVASLSGLAKTAFKVYIEDKTVESGSTTITLSSPLNVFDFSDYSMRIWLSVRSERVAISDNSVV